MGFFYVGVSICHLIKLTTSPTLNRRRTMFVKSENRTDVRTECSTNICLPSMNHSDKTQLKQYPVDVS